LPEEAHVHVLADEDHKETSSGEFDFLPQSPLHSPVYEDESLATPTIETKLRLHEEAIKYFAHSAKCQAIALSMRATSPILPFSTIPTSFE